MLLRRLNLPSRLSVRLIAVLAVMLAMGTQLPGQESLEDEVRVQYDKATAETTELTSKLSQMQAAGDEDAAAEIRTRLIELRKDQQRFLDELISLDPENDLYRYLLAKHASESGNRGKAMSIINELAPLDAPGYPQAHMVLANRYYRMPAASRIKQTGNLEIALKHVDHALAGDKEDLSAKSLKAGILAKLQRYEAAYEVYDDLFETSPSYVSQLVAINEKMGREERNQSVYEKALARFQLLADMESTQSDSRQWVEIEKGIATTLQKLDRYEEAESRLEKKINLLAEDPERGARRVFLERLLSDTYIAWTDKVAGSRFPAQESLPASIQEKVLDLNIKAYRNHPKNTRALQSITWLSLSSNVEIATRAKSVYDPNADTDAPAAVLNQLANHAMIKEEVSEAIRYYERAREKTPRNPMVLNNLAYAYLAGSEDERNAERSLQLIDEAIHHLPANMDPIGKAAYHHTKGTALKQMKRVHEALVEFERSLKSRPRHADTLRAVIDCYQKLNLEVPKKHLSTLEEIEKQAPATPEQEDLSIDLGTKPHPDQTEEFTDAQLKHLFSNAGNLALLKNATYGEIQFIRPTDGFKDSLADYERTDEPAKLTLGQLQEIKDVLDDARHYGWVAARKGCAPSPGIVIRISEGDREISAVLCFACNFLAFYDNDSKLGGEDFDMMRPQLVKSLKSVFPKNELVQGLPLNGCGLTKSK